MTTTPETISLSEAVKIWAETGEWPELASDARELAGPRLAFLATSKHDIGNMSNARYFHKDQRFIKPVERKTVVEEINSIINSGNYIDGRGDVVGLLCLARRLDELEAKIK